MSPKFHTFQRILPGCEAGDRAAWKAFLARYTPIVRALDDFYLPGRARKAQAALWADALRSLCANNCDRLRGLDHQAEREFLADLRAFYLNLGASTLGPSLDTAPVPAPTLESVEALLKDLPLVQKEIVLFKLAGYSDATLERILLLPSAAIRKPLEQVEKNYGAAFDLEIDACPWPSAWLEILRRARAARREDCPSRRVLIRILDGQRTWYEKSPAEEHMARCLHCLESWAALREVNYLRRVTAPLPFADVELFLACTPIGTAAAASPSLLKRFLGR
ncbi:MAG: hypothetical protein LAO07_02060 [Acidobacteriia bacterium]|nr:hypothetical protein [Terriglobia bacterium]